MQRRTVIPGALLVSGALVALAGCTGTAGDPDQVTLTFATFQGPYEEAQRSAWLEEFTEQTGIEVVSDAYDFGKLQTMVESGDVYWDVVDVNGDVGLETSSNLLEPLDCTIITVCDTPAEGMVNTEWRVAQNQSAMVFAYNSDAFDAEPQGWADFFDTDAFPGKRTFPSWVSSGFLEAALLADGVAADELYPLDVERALAKLDTIKDDIIWWETATQSQELLASGEAVFGITFSPRVYDSNVVQAQPVDAQWNQVLLTGSYLVIPKGAPNLDAAQQLVAFIAAKENNAKMALFYPVSAGTADAEADIPAEISSWLPSSHSETAIPMDDFYWDASFGDANEKFQAWLQG